MIKVRDASSAAQKFATRGAAAAGDYKAGVASAGADWERSTAGATDNYVAGVQGAINRGAFAKGVKEAGGDYYQTRAATIGGNRFADGIRSGQQNFEQGVKPYLDVLSKMTLSPRGPKGDPRNMQRATEVATALRKQKTGE